MQENIRTGYDTWVVPDKTSAAPTVAPKPDFDSTAFLTGFGIGMIPLAVLIAVVVIYHLAIGH